MTKGRPYRYDEEPIGPLMESMLSDCQIWTRANDGRGYGVQWNSRTQRVDKAHRVAYEEAKGLIPDELEIDHLCRNRACVNPDHLEAVTHERQKL